MKRQANKKSMVRISEEHCLFSVYNANLNMHGVTSVSCNVMSRIHELCMNSQVLYIMDVEITFSEMFLVVFYFT